MCALAGLLREQDSVFKDSDTQLDTAEITPATIQPVQLFYTPHVVLKYCPEMYCSLSRGQIPSSKNSSQL